MLAVFVVVLRALSVVERFELSVVDMLRLSLALPPLLAATCAPEAPLLSEVLAVERFELSVVDMLRLSVAVLPLLAATCAPDAVDERLEASVNVADRLVVFDVFVELLALSVFTRDELSVAFVELLALSVFTRDELSVALVELFALSVEVRIELSDALLELFALSVETVVGLNEPLVAGLYDALAAWPSAAAPLFVIVGVVCANAGAESAKMLADTAKIPLVIPSPDVGSIPCRWTER